MPSSTAPLPPQGDPDAITCRHCGAVRAVRRVGDTTHRLCRNCDAPDAPASRKATWDQGAWT